MHTPFLFHPQSSDGLKFDGSHLEVHLHTETMHNVRSVQLRHEPDNEQKYVEMVLLGRFGRLDKWTARFPINQDRNVTHYVFKVQTDSAQYWLDASGVKNRIPAKEVHFKFNALHQPSEWVQSQIFYQIFPDRFCNANANIGVRSGEYAIKDGSIPTVEKSWGEPIGSNNRQMSVEFYNGDIAGIRSKLDYLQQLGVTTLYLNPVFSSLSNHKYDTTDYFNVDPHLGTNQELASLCQELHLRGMKIVLDAVFNHTSVEHPWFDKAGVHKNGAYHNVDSEYRDYYFFEGDSKEYVGWNGNKGLPVLNFKNPSVRQYIYESDDAVIKHWLRAPYNIDGWRFDVIHMLGEGEGAKNNAFYVKKFRQSAKQENPKAYILGEHFFEATQWLQGDQEDGAMNYYGFAHPVRAFFANQDIAYDPIQLSVNEFKNWLLEAKAKLPWHNQLSQLNQLDSHDTARFITLLNGDVDKMRQASVLLMTYVGVPCLYYGTEVGLEGKNDPDNRRCFPWERVGKSEWQPFFETLLAIRNQHASLQSGDLNFFNAGEDLIAFSRTLADEKLVVLLNCDEMSREFDLPVWQIEAEQGEARSLFNGATRSYSAGQLTLSLPAHGYEIIRV